MTVFQLPPETRQAVVINGALTAFYPAVPYVRRINEIQVTASGQSAVNVYRAIMDDNQRVATNPIGNNNTFNPTNRPTIPAGMEVFVRWPSLATGTAQATVTFEGDDGRIR